MKWFRKARGGRKPDPALKNIRNKFTAFYSVLEKNNLVLKLMSEMEEKALGSCPVSPTELRDNTTRIRRAVRDMIRNLVTLGGLEYETLYDRFEDIDIQIGKLLPGNRPEIEDDLIVPFKDLRGDRAWSVGGKNARLGEMKYQLGLPVPCGFAISAWAYNRFLDAGDLQGRINRFIQSVDINSFEDLVRSSDEIQRMILTSPVPDDVAEAINGAGRDLAERSGAQRFALRSSAIGEDSFHSFAGQYASFLNVPLADLTARYREVLASKFSARAIYYMLSHSLSESDLAMSACCTAMVDAAAGGVIYTRNPVLPREADMVAYSVYGLGMPLMDGQVTADEFHLSRKHGGVLKSVIAKKTALMAMGEKDLVEQPVPHDDRQKPCVSHDILNQLGQYAMQVERHYGCPQDIEWAVDRGGNLYLLQARPLRIIEDEHREEDHDAPEGVKPLCGGGAVICPGAGSGPVYHVTSARDLTDLPKGAVVTAPRPFPALATVMTELSALIIEQSGVASHTATLAREHMLPTLAGMRTARDLKAGDVVTVDATHRAVYPGDLPELVRTRRARCTFCFDHASKQHLRQVLDLIAPLNMLYPAAEDFTPDNCRTFHDITRYAHQKAMDEMFSEARELQDKDRVSLSLQSDIPLEMNVIYIDQDDTGYRSRRIREKDIASRPMQAFWQGLKMERWPPMPGSSDKGPSIRRIDSPEQRRGASFSRQSFAVLSREYMMLSLRMGYHFSTIEALCTEEPSNNYIRMQLKQGGARAERRARRVRLVSTILEALGFDNHGRHDFLDTEIHYLSPEPLLERLQILGRLTVLTKQLDMALSSDEIMDWYTRDIMKKIGVAPPPETPHES